MYAIHKAANSRYSLLKYVACTTSIIMAAHYFTIFAPNISATVGAYLPTKEILLFIHKSLYQLIGIGLRNAQNFAAPYVNFFKPKFALGIAVIKIASLCGKIKFAKIFCLIQLKLNFRLNVKILHPVLSCSERLFAGFKKCAKTYVPSNSILSTCLLCLTSDGRSLVQKMPS